MRERRGKSGAVDSRGGMGWDGINGYIYIIFSSSARAIRRKSRAS